MKNTNYIGYALLAVVILGGTIAFSTFIRGSDPARNRGNISTVRENEQNTALVGQVVLLGNTQNIHWSKENFPSNFVKISVIKKVSEYPARYDLVRIISDKTANDGLATWVPTNKDVGENVFIEIGCVESTEACSPYISASSLAVNYSPSNLNTAAAYQAIEQEDNYR